jgi:hypothetical protein
MCYDEVQDTLIVDVTILWLISPARSTVQTYANNSSRVLGHPPCLQRDRPWRRSIGHRNCALTTPEASFPRSNRDALQATLDSTFDER